MNMNQYNFKIIINQLNYIIMTTKIDMYDIADSNSLQVEQITKGTNGYPSGLGDYFLRGFKDWEQLKEFSDTYNLPICVFKKKAGWHFWENLGEKHSYFTDLDYLEELGYNYSAFYDPEIEYESLMDNIRIIDGDYSDNIKHIKQMLNNFEDCLHEFNIKDDNETVIVCDGKYYETIKNELLTIQADSKTWVIGLLIEDLR